MSDEGQRSPLLILFLVVLIDMIGFTLVIPFLTYFVQDLAEADGFIVGQYEPMSLHMDPCRCVFKDSS